MLEYILYLWPQSLVRQALLVGAAVGLGVYFLSKKRYKLPPGPRGWPLVGSVFEIGKGRAFEVLHEWSKTYGPVMTIAMGPRNAIILSRIDVVMEALLKRQADFAGRPFSVAGDIVSDGGRNIIFGQYGPTWKLHRRLASKAMRTYLKGDLLNRKVSQSLAISTGLMRKQTGPFDPFPYIGLAAFNIVYGICLDKLCNDVDDEMFISYTRTLTEVVDAFSSGFLEDIFPFLRHCPTPKCRNVIRKVERVQNVLMGEVQQHRATLAYGKARDFTDTLLLAQMEAEKEEDPDVLNRITDIHIMLTVSDVFFAGIDTSRNTLHWCLLAMALHPDIQKKVQEEVDSVIGPELNVNQSDRERLPYTEAVLYETMRLRPVAPIGIPHETMCDTTVGGYDVPKGTMVMVSHYALHLDSDQWDNVNEFRPERFLDASGKMAPKPDSWLPFSAGRRVCLGEVIAKPELHLILAGLMRAFTVSLPPGETHDFKANHSPVGTLNLPGKYNVVVESRI